MLELHEHRMNPRTYGAKGAWGPPARYLRTICVRLVGSSEGVLAQELIQQRDIVLLEQRDRTIVLVRGALHCDVRTLFVLHCYSPTRTYRRSRTTAMDGFGSTPLPRLSVDSRFTALTTGEDLGSMAEGGSVMKRKTVLAVFTLVLVYLVLGGVVFWALEKPLESRLQLTVVSSKVAFLNRHTCVASDELEQLIHTITIAVKGGVNPIANATNVTSHWGLGDAFFFAGTVITTIGFGNTAPSTEGGRIVCIVYSIIGIPLFGILLAGVGDQLGTIFGKGITHVEKIFVERKISQIRIRVISAFLFVLAGCLFFVALPTVIFKYIEQWSTLEALYFVVITLTTIGFGDYVAGGNPAIRYGEWYKPLVWFWILIGLAYFAAMLSMIGYLLHALSRRTRKEVVEIRAQAAEWKANMTAEIKQTRRRLSVEIHDKLQRVGTSRRRVNDSSGLRRHSVDVFTTMHRQGSLALTPKSGSADGIAAGSYHGNLLLPNGHDMVHHKKRLSR